MKESFSIFSAISNLFEERQGLEKSGRGVAKRRWKRRSSCKKSKKTPQEWKGTEEQRLFPLFETQRRILPHGIEESSTRGRTALPVKEEAESPRRVPKSIHKEEEDARVFTNRSKSFFLQETVSTLPSKRKERSSSKRAGDGQKM